MPKAGLMFAKKDDWATPKSIVAHFGKFDYDPATTKAKADEFGVANFDTIETDGLKSDWTRFRRIWINPPFTRKQEFLKKAVETFWQTKADIYILLPIDFLTTKSFHDILRPWGGVVYVPNGRIKFENGLGKTSSPAFGSCIVKLADISTIIMEQFEL